MLNLFLKDFVSVDRVMNAVAAGTTDQTSAAVDMKADESFDEVTFMAAFGALTATQVTKIKVQQSDDDGATDTYDDIAGTESAALADTDGNKMLLVTVRPLKRFVKCIVDRGTANAVIDGVWAFKRRSKKVPVTQSSDVVGWETHDSKAEGTA